MMRPVALLLVLLLTATALAGCMQPRPAFVTDWEREAAAHGPMGVAATFELESTEYAIVGEGTLDDLAAPFDLVPTQGIRGGHHLFFNATVLGVGTGILVLDAPRITFTEGTLVSYPIAKAEPLQGGLTGWLSADPPAKPDVRFPDDGSDIGSAWFFADGAPITATDLVVEDAEQARILMDGNLTQVPFPIRFDASYLAAGPDSALHFDTATASFSSFGYAGTTSAGTVRPVAMPAIERPHTVFGNDATLRLAPDAVTTAGTFRLTQATDADGYALPATLELRPDDEQVQVRAGNSTWVQVRYRESGYVGTAVLANVTVEGAAAPMVAVPLSPPPWIVEQLWDEVSESGMIAPLAALPLAIASPFLILGEALFKGLDCFFNDCPADHPYPGWIEPGETGRFYYKVDAADTAPGDYEGTIRFIGANHETVELPVHIQVRG